MSPRRKFWKTSTLSFWSLEGAAASGCHDQRSFCASRPPPLRYGGLRGAGSRSPRCRRVTFQLCTNSDISTWLQQSSRYSTVPTGAPTSWAIFPSPNLAASSCSTSSAGSAHIRHRHHQSCVRRMAERVRRCQNDAARIIRDGRQKGWKKELTFEHCRPLKAIYLDLLVQAKTCLTPEGAIRIIASSCSNYSRRKS
jgi:hypothetical protein